MGRPIKKNYVGNVSTGGEQIEGYAWTAGDSQARLSYIVKQKSTSSYVMASTDGTGVAGGGQVYLVNGAVTTAGQGNIKVVPYGAQGQGATATANLGASSATVVVSGTGGVGADYYPSLVLNVNGGTYTGNQQANVTVETVRLRTVTPNNPGGGGGYAQGDYFIFSGAGFTTNANISVASVDGSGNILTWSVENTGVYVSSQLRTDPVTANVVVTSAGAGATWNLGWGVRTLSIANAGDYPTIPANPVSLTGGGGGATANLTYGVSTVKVTAAGTEYEIPPRVTFSTGGATAHTTLAGSGVATVVVDSAGSGYTAKPTVTIAPQGTTAYVRKLTDRIVYTWEGAQYEWLLEGQALPGYGWAHLKSS